MLCLNDSIRHDDPSVQQLLKPIEEAQTLTQLILAVWSLARVLALHLLEYVLAECAQQPTTWPPCPRCGTSLRSKGFAQRQLTRGEARLARGQSGCADPFGPASQADRPVRDAPAVAPPGGSLG